ncbi:MAG TPA: hypothetical protein VLA34_04240, partial [Candidatus Krumholzibacterium sp.]|nr:hypothetical protein [Candidatus Krumholzibacterium sp.]
SEILKAAQELGYGQEKQASDDQEEKKSEKKARVNYTNLRAQDIISHLQSEYGREEKTASEKSGWERFTEALSKASQGN